MKKPNATLNTSTLLGFRLLDDNCNKLISHQQQNTAVNVKMGTKLGSKIGSKPGTKTGMKA